MKVMSDNLPEYTKPFLGWLSIQRWWWPQWIFALKPQQQQQQQKLSSKLIDYF